MLYGAIEAGGTKFVCSVGDTEYNTLDKISIKTTSPEETFKELLQFFDQYKDKLISFGIGSFGPIEVDINSDKYGFITNTPKNLWKNFDFLGTLKNEFDIPMYWTTDVNASAYGEYHFGNGEHASSLVYVTIGTGIGGGAIQNGEFIGGISHPEMGHMIVKPYGDSLKKGNCPFHDYCLEGFASGPSIQHRTGVRAELLDENSIEWDIEAYYIAQAVLNITYTIRPELIILGGGVMNKDNLIQKVHENYLKVAGNYLEINDIAQYIVLPKLGGEAAIKGCYKLAEKALSN